VTRARHELLLSGAFWSSGVRPRTPSPFLRELIDAGVVPPAPRASELTDNPLGDAVETFEWPRDPLGGRRTRVEWAAEQVRSAIPRASGRWERDLSLLLAERESRLSAATRVALPARVSASRFKDFVTDPASVARSLRRPMPERPYRATRLGTLFHSWVEQRYALGGTSEQLDASPLELDDGPVLDEQFGDAERLSELQATFARSAWGDRRPVDVEREIHVVLDGQVIVCKIDAVYETTDGRLEIVDWKTGKAPKDAADLEAKQFQLALYRLAYALWRGIDADLIDAVFYFVADDAVVRPERIFDEAELVERWRAGALA
jgi:DNA helicase-2/ATP-dependent DNA helicase PcrA